MMAHSGRIIYATHHAFFPYQIAIIFSCQIQHKIFEWKYVFGFFKMLTAVTNGSLPIYKSSSKVL